MYRPDKPSVYTDTQQGVAASHCVHRRRQHHTDAWQQLRAIMPVVLTHRRLRGRCFYIPTVKSMCNQSTASHHPHTHTNTLQLCTCRDTQTTPRQHVTFTAILCCCFLTHDIRGQGTQPEIYRATHLLCSQATALTNLHTSVHMCGCIMHVRQCTQPASQPG